MVRERIGALDVLEILRRSPAQMVLVYDEYGNFEGIITPMDVLQAIAGDFDGDAEDEPCILERGRQPADRRLDGCGRVHGTHRH
nr:CBS domain-containing protein [Paracoccus saliphilus]